MAITNLHDAHSVHRHDAIPDLLVPGHLEEGEACIPADIRVREYHLSDCMVIPNMSARFELNHPASELLNPSALKLMVRRVFQGNNERSPLFIAEHRMTSERLGSIQAVQSALDARCELQYLAIQQPDSDWSCVAIALLEHAIAEAGWQGARRVMARAHMNSPLSPVLRACNFRAFAHERVFHSDGIANTPRPSRARPQEQSDVWAVHQLYLQTTPRDVQNAEALTSHEWEIDAEGRTRRAWFIPGDVGIRAWARVRTSRAQHVLDVMYVPDATSTLEQLLSTVFVAIANLDRRPMFALVRSYQQEVATTLLTFGMEPKREQDLWVRYTTAPVQYSVRPVEAFERVRASEAEAQRVPSFCTGEAND